MIHSPIRRVLPATVLTAVLAVVLAGCAGTPRRDAVHRLPASYNFAFYDTYPAAARSFYAAHFAHFGVYEVLLAYGAEADDAMEDLRREILDYVAGPPKFEPPAEIIAPNWSKLAWRTGQSMDWTHMLHSQLYDILTHDQIIHSLSATRVACLF